MPSPRICGALFRATGTTHLMVVSGLHVGIFVGFIHGLAFMLLRCLRFLSQRLGATADGTAYQLDYAEYISWPNGIAGASHARKFDGRRHCRCRNFSQACQHLANFLVEYGGAGVAATKSHSASGFLAFLCSGFGPFVVFRATQAAAILGSRFNALPRGAAGVFDALAWCNCW